MTKEDLNFQNYVNTCKKLAGNQNLNIEDNVNYFRECFDARITEQKALIHFNDVIKR